MSLLVTDAMGLLVPDERCTSDVPLKQDMSWSREQWGEMCPPTYSEEGENQSRRGFFVWGALGLGVFGSVLCWRRLERNLERGGILFCSADGGGLVELCLFLSLSCLELMTEALEGVMEVVDRVGRRVEAMDDHTLRCDGAIGGSTAVDISEIASSDLRDFAWFSVVSDSIGCVGSFGFED